MRAKKIGIDARFYGTANKGLGRYVQELVKYLLEADSVNQYVLFLNKHNFDLAPEHPRVKKVLADVGWYTLAEQLLMPKLIAAEQLDLMHYPNFNVPILAKTPFVVTVHDLILFRYPTKRGFFGRAFYWLKLAAYHYVIKWAIKNARLVIAASEYTKQDVLQEFEVAPEKIQITYVGLAAEFNKPAQAQVDEQLLLSLGISRPYFLYVGNAYPHKNTTGLLACFAGLRQSHPDWRIVFVGKDDYYYNLLKTQACKLGLSMIAAFPGYLTDQQLEAVYAGARAFVFPSLYEGFGVPPLEAMARGCPVVSSSRSCMPEILGDAALYFDPESEASLVEAMERVSSDESLRQDLIARGLKQAAKYSWPDCARQTLAIYQDVLSD